MKLDVHDIGIVVDDIDGAKKIYENAFGMSGKARYIVHTFKAEVRFIPATNIYIELVKPLTDDGLSLFLRKHGSGMLHHICYVVEDMAQAVQYFSKEKGLSVIRSVPQDTSCFEKALFFERRGTGNNLMSARK